MVYQSGIYWSREGFTRRTSISKKEYLIATPLTNYDPPYKTLFFLCYSTVAAIVATEAGLLSNPDSYVARQSHEAFVDDYESYLADKEKHPWCGTGRMDDVEIGFSIPDGSGGVRFIIEAEYQGMEATRSSI